VLAIESPWYNRAHPRDCVSSSGETKENKEEERKKKKEKRKKKKTQTALLHSSARGYFA
jgi:hypothetical protein